MKKTLLLSLLFISVHFVFAQYEKVYSYQLRGIDANGVALRIGDSVEVTGVVHGVNMLLGISQYGFIVMDATGGIYMYDNALGTYTVTEGDSVTVQGTVAQFRGLTELRIHNIVYLNSGNTLSYPRYVPTVDESTENHLITLFNVHLADTSQWQSAPTGGFNVLVTNGGPDTVLMRINENTDIYGTSTPLGNFNLTGIGSQYDFSSPYNAFYQIQPMKLSHFEFISLACTDTTVIQDTNVVFINDTTFYMDTTIVTINDTSTFYDTTLVTYNDTITINVTDTTFITQYDTIVNNVFDTTFVTQYDTNYTSIAVTDTLIIDVTFSGLPPNNTTKIRVYPNPTKDIVNISLENFSSISDHTIKITNSVGQVVFSSLATQPSFAINIADFGQTGMYFISVLDGNSGLVSVKTIILQ